ncbi:MAG: cation:proton antiporter regulatory subunit [Acidimicrobiia bacterium]|nr:cation:proton antiporter regulatory subunit [Acidimicrobiia bacterium]
MPEIEETALPGLGVRFEFRSDEGHRIGVVHHRNGRRELFVCTPADIDSAALTLQLSDDESHALADALGGSSVIESLGAIQQIAGLAIDWLPVEPGTPYVGKAIGDAEVRTRTGVSVVAVIRGDEAHPAPGTEFTFESGDLVVVVGTADGIKTVRTLLTAG